MPVEEHKELRELVTQTLQAKGVLEKVQAEIRASVFLALEEQDVFKDKSPFINKPLQEFVATNDGLLAISLIREFLEFFNLEFTAMVFDPETHAGINYSYEGRTKLAKDLMLDISDNKLPLLALILKLLKSSTKKLLEAASPKSVSSKSDEHKLSEELPSFSNGINGNVPIEDVQSSQDEKQLDSLNLIDLNKSDENIKPEVTKISAQPPVFTSSTSLASLSNLPPLTRTSLVAPTNTKREENLDPKDIKAILEVDTGSECDLPLSPPSDKLKKRNKTDSGSEAGEEIVEEISDNSSEPLDEDNTIDVAISRESGKGDYMEDV